MFDDPQVIIGVVLGLAIVAGGTVAGVLGQRRREPGSDSPDRTADITPEE